MSMPNLLNVRNMAANSLSMVPSPLMMSMRGVSSQTPRIPVGVTIPFSLP